MWKNGIKEDKGFQLLVEIHKELAKKIERMKGVFMMKS